MNSNGNGDVDEESLAAVQSLRSKFEQLAVDTSSSIKKTSSSEGLNTRLRPSISSSDLKVPTTNTITKRTPPPPPPPPPPRLNRPSPSPISSRSPSPMPALVRLGSGSGIGMGTGERDEGGLSGVSALKNKFESPRQSPRPSINVDSSKPILPPRPLISVSPSNTNYEPSSSTHSSPTPQHHRPPPPPPPRSRSPLPLLVDVDGDDDDDDDVGAIRSRLSPVSIPSSRQQTISTPTTTTKVKPAVPPRPTSKLVESPQSSLDTFNTFYSTPTPNSTHSHTPAQTKTTTFTYNVVTSPDSMSSLPISPAPAIPARRRRTSDVSIGSMSTSSLNEFDSLVTPIVPTSTPTSISTSTSTSSSISNYKSKSDSTITTMTTNPIMKSKILPPPPPRHRSTLSPPSSATFNNNNSGSSGSGDGIGMVRGLSGSSSSSGFSSGTGTGSTLGYGYSGLPPPPPPPPLQHSHSHSTSSSGSGSGSSGYSGLPLPPPPQHSLTHSHTPPPLPTRRVVGGEEQVQVQVQGQSGGVILKSPRIPPPPPPPVISASSPIPITTTPSTAPVTTAPTTGPSMTMETDRKFLPPPVRIIGLGDKVPVLRKQQQQQQLGRGRGQGRELESDEDEDEDEDEYGYEDADEDILNSNTNININTNTNINTNATMNTTTTSVGGGIDNIPDSSQSFRRPPIFSSSGSGSDMNTKIQVHPYNGICVSWGSVIVTGYGHFVKVYDVENGNGSVYGSGEEVGVLDVRELGFGFGVGVGVGVGVTTLGTVGTGVGGGGVGGGGGGKDWKVSALEFRILGSGSSNAKGTGISKLKKELRPVLWIGTKEGSLFEVDVMCMLPNFTTRRGGRGGMGGKGIVRAMRLNAHAFPISHIFRYGRKMVSLDESGKTLIFSNGFGGGGGGGGDEDEDDEDEDEDEYEYDEYEDNDEGERGREVEGDWEFLGVGVGVGVGGQGRRQGKGTGKVPLLNSQPRVVRTTEKQEFVKLLDGKLWTATRTETSSYPPSSTHPHSHSHPHALHSTHTHGHGYGYQKLPIIRIYDIFNPISTMGIGRSLLPCSHVGSVTCATTVPTNPGFVYVGHEEGYISIWDLNHNGFANDVNVVEIDQDPSQSQNQNQNQNQNQTTYPKCIEVLKIGSSDVLCVEGVNDRLWVGGRNGVIRAFEVVSRPWIETNCWVAHQGVPVLRLNVNVGGVVGWVGNNNNNNNQNNKERRGRGRLCVVSVGRDECVRIWDGLLGVDWIEKEVQKQEREYSSYRTLSLLLVSWNCDSAKPDSLIGDAINMDFLPSVLNSYSSLSSSYPSSSSSASISSTTTPDIIAFGFQEVIDLESRKMTAKNVLLGGSKSGLKVKAKSKFGSLKKDKDKGKGGGGGGDKFKDSEFRKRKLDEFGSGVNEFGNGNGISEKVTGAYKRWFDKLSAEVRCLENSSLQIGGGGGGGGRYTAVHTENLVGLFSCIFVKEKEREMLKDGAVTTVKRGMGGRYGNKGGIVARFVIGDSSICIINCHLAAGQNAVRRRNADAAGLLEEKEVFPIGDQELAYVGGGDGSMVLDHEIVFFHGDLNYRIDQRRDAIIAAVKARDLSSLYVHDQLLREIKFNRGFRLRGFQEGKLTFDPTYKYDRRSNEYDSSEKHRAPAWCDRILWKSRIPGRVRLLEYRRYEVDVSDHRPVSALFEVEVKSVDMERRGWVRRYVEERWVEEEERLVGFVKQFYLDQKVLV